MPARSTAPDLIFFNGIIYTGAGFAEDQPQVVQAIAIGRGKVLAIGTSAEITHLAGANTHLRDLDSTGTSTFLFPASTMRTRISARAGRRGSTSTSRA